MLQLQDGFSDRPEYLDLLRGEVIVDTVVCHAEPLWVLLALSGDGRPDVGVRACRLFIFSTSEGMNWRHNLSLLALGSATAVAIVLGIEAMFGWLDIEPRRLTIRIELQCVPEAPADKPAQ